MQAHQFAGLAGKSALVTGGAGFIGSHLVRSLLSLGVRTRVLDDLSTGRMENLAVFLPHIQWLQGSLADKSVVAAAVEGVEFVLHQGAIPSVPRSIEEPEVTHRANVEGTLNLLQAARRGGVRRVVFASSSAVYGSPSRMPVHEELPVNPLSPYAVQKLAAEQYCRVFTEVYGLETVSLRYFNVFGPGQDPASEYAAVIPKAIQALIEGRPFRVFGDGRQSRDFTYVENVVLGNLLALVTPGAAGRVLNLACGAALSLNELLEELSTMTDRNLPVEYGPPRPGDVRHSAADITAARAVLGYEPRVSVCEGLRRTLDWYLDRRPERTAALTGAAPQEETRCAR